MSLRTILVVAIVVVAAVGVLLNRPWEPTVPTYIDCSGEIVATLPPVVDVPSTGFEEVTVYEGQDVTQVVEHPLDGSLLVTHRSGTVVHLGPDRGEVVLDLGDLPLEGQGGLMTATVDPNGEWLYVSYTSDIPDLVNYLQAFRFDRSGAIQDTPAEIFALPQPTDIHNLGGMVFGPDGLLYIGSGDGGSDELEPDPRRVGQDTSNLYGAILRIAPTPESGGYEVPSDNPMVEVAGARPEIWMTGLREPWRFSFDSESNSFWVGDVGQYCYEEVTTVPAERQSGANLGWSAFEGPMRSVDRTPTSHVPPIYAYRREAQDAGGVARCAIIAGEVYRHERFPTLDGWFLFSDWCSSQVEAIRSTGKEVERQVVASGLSGMAQSMTVTRDGRILIAATDGVHELVPKSA